MYKKILLTVIPQGYWITLLVASLLALIGGEFLSMASIGFNLVIFRIGVKLSIGIHEIGHLLFALFVGGTPRRLILGKGHNVAESKIYGIKLILNAHFNSGRALAAFDNLRFIRMKLLLFASGGFLTNLIVAGLLFFLFDFSVNITSGIQLSSALVIANLLTGVSVLIPWYSNYQGIRYYSDGILILRIPFYKKSQLVELSLLNEFIDAVDLVESKKYEEAIAIYESIQVKTGGAKTINLNLSIAHIKLGNYERAVALMEECLPLIDEEPFKGANNLIYNEIAWGYLLLNRLDEADNYSKLAYEINPHYVAARGTRASVLIEMGKFAEGKKLLINDVDFNFPNSDTLLAALYVGVAFYQLNEHKNAEKYLKFVEEHINLLEVDEKSLYQRAKEKWLGIAVPNTGIA